MSPGKKGEKPMKKGLRAGLSALGIYIVGAASGMKVADLTDQLAWQAGWGGWSAFGVAMIAGLLTSVVAILGLTLSLAWLGALLGWRRPPYSEE
jgi:hypothetical protein